MREVEVDVNVPQLQLEEKQVTITSNGKHIITPSKGYDAMKEVEVDVQIPQLRFDLIGWDECDIIEFNNSSNVHIAYSKTLYDAWNPSKTSTSYLYTTNRRLVYAPHIDTSNVTSMSGMFQYCNALKVVPKYDTRKVTSMASIFYQCSSLLTIPQLDTSKVTSINQAFFNCSSLFSLPLFDASSWTNVANMFNNNYILAHLGGFKNLKVSLSLSPCPELTHDSLMNVINNLYDLASNGLSAQTLTLGATNLAKLTEEEKAIAVNKGWTLA
jgi:surface protein